MKGKIIIVISLIVCISVLVLGILGFFSLFSTLTERPIDYSILCKQATIKLQVLPHAIESYKNTNGQYPKTLQALIPGFINYLPKLPNGFYVYKDDENKGIEYCLISTQGCQPYSLSTTLARSSLSSDVTLYYRKNTTLLPVAPDVWKLYKHKIVINENWICCY